MIFQGKGENNFPAHKLRQKPKAAKGRALYQISGFCHHIWSICRSATAWIWHHYSHRCASVTLGHRYRNTNPRLNAKYTKDTSMLNNQHGRVSCQKMSGLCQSDARSLWFWQPAYVYPYKQQADKRRIRHTLPGCAKLAGKKARRQYAAHTKQYPWISGNAAG